METLTTPVTYLSLAIGLLALIMTWQTFKNGKIFKEHFVSVDKHLVKMDEHFVKMDDRAEQRHLEVTKLLEKGFGDMGEWMKRTGEILEKGFGILIRDVNEIKTKPEKI